MTVGVAAHLQQYVAGHILIVEAGVEIALQSEQSGTIVGVRCSEVPGYEFHALKVGVDQRRSAGRVACGKFPVYVEDAPGLGCGVGEAQVAVHRVGDEPVD